MFIHFNHLDDMGFVLLQMENNHEQKNMLVICGLPKIDHDMDELYCKRH